MKTWLVSLRYLGFDGRTLLYNRSILKATQADTEEQAIDQVAKDAGIVFDEEGNFSDVSDNPNDPVEYSMDDIEAMESAYVLDDFLREHFVK